MRRIIALAIGFTVACSALVGIGQPALAAGTTFYVDAASGSDSNNGTSLSTPYKTIQKAAGVAVAGDSVLIRGGTYRETVTPANGGTVTAPITYAPYGGETVTISGADLATGSWSVDTGSIYKTSYAASMGHKEQVFVNGKMINLAQWPNDPDINDMFNSFYATVDQGTDSASLSSLTDAGIASKPSNYFAGGTIWWLAGKKWVALGTAVTSSSGNTINYTAPTGWEASYMNPGSFTDGANQYFVSGTKAMLDTGNEWYADSSNLYLQLPSGGSPATSTVEVKSRDYAFDFNTKNYVTVNNLNTFAGAVKMSGNSDNWNGGTLKYSYHNDSNGAGEFFPGGEGTYGNVVSGNADSITNTTIQYSAAQGVDVTGNDALIDNNYVYDTGYKSSYDEAIRLAPTANRATVTRNTIARTGQVCIGGGWNNTASNYIAYNDCSYAQQLGDDRGGIQAKGSEVAFNVVHDIGRGLALSITPAFYTDTSGDNVTYHNNVAYNIAHDGTFRVNDTGSPADGNSNIAIYNNTSYSAPSSQLALGTTSTIATANNVNNASSGNFVNAVAHDFRLASGSGLIDSGSVVSPYTDGFAGSAPDQGAYESGASTGKAGWTAGVGSTVYFGPTSPTPYLVNGSFDTNASNNGQIIYGWTTDGYGSDSDADYTEAYGGAYDGTYHATHYKGTPYQVYTYQTASIPNGTYKLTAYVKSSGGQSYCLMDIKGFDSGGSDIQHSIGSTSVWTQISISNVAVTQGHATVGFYSMAGAGQWLYFDDVQLTKQ